MPLRAQCDFFFNIWYTIFIFKKIRFCMKLETIYLLRSVIIAFMSYVPTVTISGWFEAFIAKKMGDTIPEKSGFLTFDPFVHFNPWGFCLMFVRFPGFGFAGFGNVVPLTPEVLTKQYRNVRAAGEFFARPIIHFCMMFTAFLIMIISYQAVFDGIENNLFLMQHSVSTVHLVVILLLLFFFQQNFFLFIISFFVGLYRLILFIFFPEFQISSLTHSLVYILSFAVVIIVLGMVLQDITQNFLFLVQNLLR